MIEIIKRKKVVEIYTRINNRVVKIIFSKYTINS